MNSKTRGGGWNWCSPRLLDHFMKQMIVNAFFGCQWLSGELSGTRSTTMLAKPPESGSASQVVGWHLADHVRPHHQNVGSVVNQWFLVEPQILQNLSGNLGNQLFWDTLMFIKHPNGLRVCNISLQETAWEKKKKKNSFPVWCCLKPTWYSRIPPSAKRQEWRSQNWLAVYYMVHPQVNKHRWGVWPLLSCPVWLQVTVNMVKAILSFTL